MNWKNRTGWQSFSINLKAWIGAGICLTAFLAILILPILPVQAAPGLLPDMQEEAARGLLAADRQRCQRHLAGGQVPRAGVGILPHLQR